LYGLFRDIFCIFGCHACSLDQRATVKIEEKRIFGAQVITPASKRNETSGNYRSCRQGLISQMCPILENSEYDLLLQTANSRGVWCRSGEDLKP
jgi:hypothetical protein